MRIFPIILHRDGISNERIPCAYISAISENDVRNSPGIELVYD